MSRDGSKLSSSNIVDTVAGRTGDVVLTEADISGLVADLAAKADLASPALTGSPTAPTQAQGDNTTKIATDQFVQTELGYYVPKSLVDAKGDILIGTADNTITRKAVGANNTVLSADSSQTDGTLWKLVSALIKLGGADRVYPADIGEFFDRRRSSELQTMPRILSGTNTTPTSGNPIAPIVFARTAGTFTQIRFATGTTTPSGMTDCRLGVWGSDGITKQTETANMAASVTTANTIYTFSLGASVTVAEGDILYIGGGWIGTLTLRGLSGTTAAIGGLSGGSYVVMGRGATGWTTGNVLPNLSVNGGTIAWVELVP